MLLTTNKSAYRPGIVGVNWSNPLTRNLLTLVVGTRDLVSGLPLTKVAGANFSFMVPPSHLGGTPVAGLDGTSSGDYWQLDIPVGLRLTVNEFFLFVIGGVRTNSTARKRLVRFYNATHGSIVYADIGDGTLNYAGIGYQDSLSAFPVDQWAPPSAGQLHTLSARKALSSGAIDLGYTDGFSQTILGSLTGTSTLRGTPDTLAIGGNTFPISGTVGMVALWADAKSEEFTRLIHASPWQLVSTGARRMYFGEVPSAGSFVPAWARGSNVVISPMGMAA